MPDGHVLLDSSDQQPTVDKLILVTGATGYIGNRLIPNLLAKGYRLRVFVRDAKRLHGRPWIDQVEVAEGDVLDIDSLHAAMQHVRAAFYLIHNMSSGRHYETREIESARNFACAAQAACLEQIVYLGGLADPGEQIGTHMLSRIHTGDSLRTGSVPVTEFRASLIIGAGSTSFEMIRYLTEQFPLLIGPRSLRNIAQPVAVDDVLAYLQAALECPACRGRIYEIGGPDRLSYAEVMLTYARLRCLKRQVLVLPWIPAGLMAFIVGRITPIPRRIARPLIGGMRASSIVHTEDARTFFYDIHPATYQQALESALEALTPSRLEPVWQNGAALTRMMTQGFFVEHRQVHLVSEPEAVYKVVTCLGGRNGWLYWNWAWQLRGWIDRLAGGPGMRGRRSTDSLCEKDLVDYYRVEAVEPSRRLLLRAELKAPGQGWMEWQIRSNGAGSLLSQTAYFAPRGLSGFLYWSLLLPLHTTIFAGLIRAIARRAEESATIKGQGGEHEN